MESHSITLDITAKSLKETQSLGEKIGKNLGAKLAIGLSGSLGSGKTSFVQGLARGLDVPNNYYITSPTYSIIHEYPGRIPLFHIDLYRIRCKDEIEETGLYEILDRFGIFAIEWPDFVINDLGADFLSIHFEFAGDDTREIRITANGEKAAELIREL
ncbi:MAG: tRNA (adenosine(37)-N6)-threonylcarbamoyltransferase complex ATPase subunit type 1 TsaE [Proteobacteria bacterium]|nr:tRNA (adenosine(37)-N6)-threonylcarbamoyltransferase complex ATPase subunit type 1 TsaE [Pseudomonadota bacterium]MBU1713497.1 tRNA (adenosine(37)-N6)-threonylcarbamoyltransferase complex ATPase subunit type 1 TsaE [Pseudomonadota bacterium]